MGKFVKYEDAEKKIEDLEKNINNEIEVRDLIEDLEKNIKEIEGIGKNLDGLNKKLWEGYRGDTISSIQNNIYTLEKKLKIINKELKILENKDTMPVFAENPYIKEKGGLGNIVSKAKEKIMDVEKVTRNLSDDLSDPNKLEQIQRNRRY